MLSLYNANNVQNEMRNHLIKERKRQKLTVAELAQKSGVPYGTLRKFEASGNISLRQFLMLLEGLSKLAPLHDFATTQPAMPSIKEVLSQI